MTLLTVTNLTKSFTTKVILDHVTFSLNEGQKVALVAKNGAGKSTLLTILEGKTSYSEGDVARKKGITVGFLSQHIDFDTNLRVLDALFAVDTPVAQTIKAYEKAISCPTTPSEELNEILHRMEELNARAYETKVNIIINKLSLTSLLEQSVASLSGGEMKRLALARVLASEPDLLLLDEPTNHLDIPMIEWLEWYLSQEGITLLMVTHDRYFLERVCDTIRELDRGKLHTYPGNYSYFLEKKEERMEHEKLHLHEMKKIYKQELAWIRKAPSGRGKKSVSREQRFEDIATAYKEKGVHVKENDARLTLSMAERKMGDKVLKLYNISKTFGQKKILTNFTYEFKNRERVGIIGNNGVGKSTFIRLLMEQEQPDTGAIKKGESIIFGHYTQQEPHYPPGKKVLDVVQDVSEFMLVGKNEKLLAPRALELFLFPPAQQHTFAEGLSGGEKRRLHLLTVLMKNPNFLILDEPTNDLDLVTLQVLEDFLLSYQGCLSIISHDRFFMDKLVDHIFIFEGDGVVTDFRGTYTEYKEMKETEKGEEKKKSEKKEVVIEVAPQTKKKLSFNEQREFAELISDVEKLENRRSEINRLFEDTSRPYDEIRKLTEELTKVGKEIDRREARWLELSERA